VKVFDIARSQIRPPVRVAASYRYTDCVILAPSPRVADSIPKELICFPFYIIFLSAPWSWGRLDLEQKFCRIFMELMDGLPPFLSRLFTACGPPEPVTRTSLGSQTVVFVTTRTEKHRL
jgi:hypothetical protein